MGSPMWVRICVMGSGSVRKAMNVRGARQVGPREEVEDLVGAAANEVESVKGKGGPCTVADETLESGAVGGLDTVVGVNTAQTISRIECPFPRHDDAVEQAFGSSESSRGLCSDYRAWATVLARCRESDSPEAPARVEECAALLGELGAGIQVRLPGTDRLPPDPSSRQDLWAKTSSAAEVRRVRLKARVGGKTS